MNNDMKVTVLLQIKQDYLMRLIGNLKYRKKHHMNSQLKNFNLCFEHLP